MNSNGFKLLKRYFGSNREIAEAVERVSGDRISWEAVRKWGIHGIPAKRVLQLHRASGRTLLPHQLRPDLYPDPDWAPSVRKETT